MLHTHCIHVVAPIKALCSERYDDWQGKFGPLGLKCCELTGDSQLDDYFELQNANIVMTTPVHVTVSFLLSNYKININCYNPELFNQKNCDEFVGVAFKSKHCVEIMC